MEVIKNIISHSLDISKYFGDETVCFLDIETTGLSRDKNVIYLIGVLYLEGTAWILKQYFANSIAKEKDLLVQFISDISSFGKIITYNGDSFDLPFINHRLMHHQINSNISKDKSFDIYRIVKNNKQYLELENLKLKTIELALGFEREDIYSGLDCIGFYYDYIKSNNKLMKDNTLKHNYDDLVHMLDIITILDIIDDKKTIILGSPSNVIKFSIDNIVTNGDLLNINGTISNPLDSNIKYFGENYNLITEDLNKFTISLEIKKGYISEKDKCRYIETNDFPNIDDLVDSSGYKLPTNIILLMVGNKYCIPNIKNLLTKILEAIVI
ncbi:ribonuclease H-like domain-containing protein [Tissierella sp.]|uniref:ribonuclease H-like domain-containing protein n=1 Tax=Tissierella sp. TaxID=41274 RepID=UPI0028637CCF|nr:ribonuclease H-like domain-containing protein [Tissierella sp.]MDR7857012.1 ribonuclease H-like domain-containing protein [Tissierella sp.]